MKKILYKAVIVTVAVMIFVSGVITCILMRRIPVENSNFGDLIVLPEYNKVRHGFSSACCRLLSDGGKCTVVAAIDEKGHSIVGRNLDLEVSEKGIYVFRTRQEGLYETIGLSNFAGIGEDAEDIVAKGIPEWYYNIIPDIAADVMNSEGLYIENNERIAEYDESGKLMWVNNGTNPDSKINIVNLCLPQYLAERCRNVDEAVKLAGEINICSFVGQGMDSNYAFLMADAGGHCGILEVMDDKVYWLDGQPVNTNFYLEEEYAENSHFGQGQGRFNAATEALPNIRNMEDMKDLMIEMFYYQSVFPDICKYDCRYEFTHEGNDWTVEDLENPDNEEEVFAYIKNLGELTKGKSRSEIAENGEYFETVYTNLVDCTDRTFTIFTHENPDNIITIGFD